MDDEAPQPPRRDVAALAPAGCATLDQLASTLVNLKRLQFRIGQVTGFRLAGIDLGRTSSLSQLTAYDALSLAGAYASRRLPAELVVEVEAVNPNDGTAGAPRTTSTLTSLECRPREHHVPGSHHDRRRAVPLTPRALNGPRASSARCQAPGFGIPRSLQILAER